MLIQLKQVLGTQQLTKIAELLGTAQFVDGKLSAGDIAATVKHKQELAMNDPLTQQLNALVMNNLLRHKTYQQAALPLRIASPFYACYETGMEYGEHIDDPIMGGQDKYRSDIAITLFLNSPEEYEGGELVIETSLGEQVIKYPAGDAVLYPASSRHRVARVTKGKRQVAVTWVQSAVRDAEKRELLYQLSCAREKLLRKQPTETYTKQVDSSYVNLVRRWSDI